MAALSTQVTEVDNTSHRGDRRGELNRVPQGGVEFLDWQVKVDRFFVIMNVPENKQVKMISIRLKSMAAVWWDKLIIQRQ
ncbi:hypothetical protein QQ045_006773 [Rhodiola kirilowii]